MKEKIIRNIKMLPSIGYGDYQPKENIIIAIAKAMNYEVMLMVGGRYNIVNYEDLDNARKILDDMINEGTLVKNKSGRLIKLK